MRIESRPPVATGAVARPRPAAARFSADAPRDSASGVAPAVGLIGLDAVLALQTEESGERERRRRAVRRGHQTLDALESLKIALLSGRLSPQDVARLAREADAAGVPSGDPRLDEILAHIELRARVELAKLAAR